MSKITLEEVAHIARLAKLSLTKKEKEKFRDQLEKIIGYFNELNEVDTAKVEPTSQTTGLNNIFRSDETNSEECLTQEEALSQTESSYNGYFKVPLIIDKK